MNSLGIGTDPMTQDLMLAGIFTITPLQNALSIFSTTLQPETRHQPKNYPVFAPTSHPLPIIAPAKHSRTSDPLSSSVMSRLALSSSFRLRELGNGSASTVFLIKEHMCGLDGLREGIVPGFSNIWLDERGPWGLRGVHPVSESAAHGVRTIEQSYR